MPNHKISHDLKLAALRLHQHGAMPLSDILQCLGISWMTFFRVQKIFRETGDVVKPRSAYCGHPRIQNHADVHYLIELIQHCPDWFLDELKTTYKLINDWRQLSGVHWDNECRANIVGTGAEKVWNDWLKVCAYDDPFMSYMSWPSAFDDRQEAQGCRDLKITDGPSIWPWRLCCQMTLQEAAALTTLPPLLLRGMSKLCNPPPPPPAGHQAYNPATIGNAMQAPPSPASYYAAMSDSNFVPVPPDSSIPNSTATSDNR